MSSPTTPCTEGMRLLGGEYPEPQTDCSDLEEYAGANKRLSLTEFLHLTPPKKQDDTDTELMSGHSAGEEEENRPVTPEIALIPFQTSTITSRDDEASSKSYKSTDGLKPPEAVEDQPSEEEDMECEEGDFEEEPEVHPEVPIYIEDSSGTVSISEQSAEKYRAGATKLVTDEEIEESSSSSEESECDGNQQLSLKEAIETVKLPQIRKQSIKPENIHFVEVSDNDEPKAASRDHLTPVPPPAAGEDLTDTEEMFANSDLDDEEKNIKEHMLPAAKREITRIKEARQGEAEQIFIENIDESRYLTAAEYKKADVPTDTEDFEGDIDDDDEDDEPVPAPDVMLPECSLVESLDTEKRSAIQTQDSVGIHTDYEDADQPTAAARAKPRERKTIDRETDVEDMVSEKI